MKLEDKIIKLAIQLHDIAKYSDDYKKCINVATIQILGNKELSDMCLQFGICKDDYLNYLLTKLYEVKE